MYRRKFPKAETGLGTVAHACNLNYLEDIGERTVVRPAWANAQK
jgi:hypothetical protein